MRVSDLVEHKDEAIALLIGERLKVWPFKRGGFDGNALMGAIAANNLI